MKKIMMGLLSLEVLPIAVSMWVLLAMGSWGEAAVLLSYSGAGYVSGDTTFARTASVSGSSGSYTVQNAFSDTVALSPSAGYAGPVFYGGYLYTISGTSNTVSGMTRQQIRNDVARDGTNAYDLIYMQDYNANGWTGATFSLSAVYVFKLGGDSTISSMSAAVSTNLGSTGYKSGVAWRWVVQTGGVYYVSENTFSNTAYVASTTTLASLSSVNWAAYNPSSGLNFNQGTASYSSIDTSRISAVGLYVENDSWSGDSSVQSLDLLIQSFVVNGTAIPEPKLGGLLFWGGVFLYFSKGLLKRKRACCN